MKLALIRLYKRLFVRRAFYRLHARLFNIGLWGMGILNSENFELSGEEHFLRHLDQYLPAGQPDVVLDVGANIGLYSSRVMELYPRARVYAFEPHAVSFKRLSEPARRLGFQAFNVAVSEVAGQAELYNRPGTNSESASLQPGVIEAGTGGPVVSSAVQVARLDDFVRTHGLRYVSLLKIDTEGHELSVLRGAAEILAAGQVDAVQFEFNRMHVISRVFLRDIREALSGFYFYRLLPDGLVPISFDPPFRSEIFAFQNIAALRVEAGRHG
jgi:FkbM family methyltransferase